MKTANYLILSQYKENSDYDDLVGFLYHFPEKYKNQIKPNSEFIYYEPSKNGTGSYFGYGKIGSIGTRKDGQFFAQIIDYHPFPKEVYLKREDGSLWEDTSTYNAQNAVRYSTKSIIDNICKAGNLIPKRHPISFQTRARTVDMLGRQQIAGIPTAINELFKNAHDAYADNVIVDYYTSDKLFVLRDDGLGMTLDDLTNRWLTLGTDSKVENSKNLRPPQVDPTKQKRPSMGEKGIGRLAVSIIGPQVLILSRSKRFNENNEPVLGDVIAAFINWGLFEVPGINIDQITIPIRTFIGETLPNENDVIEMAEEVKANLESFHEQVPDDLYERISNELNSFRFDPKAEEIFFQNSDIQQIKDIGDGEQNPLILSKFSGTHFYITPSDESILEDLTTDSDEPSELEKYLLGFTNTMLPGHKTPHIKASFRQHNKTDDLSIDIIKESKFFTPEDFTKSDHHFYGSFDEYGQFHGFVSIYGKEPVEYHLPWPGNYGKKTDCGTFCINFAALQGTPAESSLPPLTQREMYTKTEKHGGLYIYKDGIRVLPYGDANFDFLEIEKRRAKNAGTAYFSYRKMFGAIEINQKENSDLREKAGREGFQENKAYRQFKDILKHFLQQVAADFTHEKGIYSDAFINEKNTYKAQDKLRKKREERKTEKRTKFLHDFKQALGKLQSLEHIEGVEKTKKNLKQQLNHILVFDDSEKIASKIIELESNVLNELSALEKEYSISRPQGIVIKTKTDNNLWIAYQAELNNALDTVFEPTKEYIEKTISDAIQDARVEVDRRRRIETSLKSHISETKKNANSESKQVLKQNDSVDTEVKKVARESIRRIEETIRSVTEDFNKTDFSNMTETEIAKLRLSYEDQIDSVAAKEKKTLQTIQTLLESVSWEFDDQGNIATDLDIYEANERALDEANEQIKSDMQLAQIGTAINIINHEFDSSIRTVRRNLSRLKAWADVNENLQEIYNDVRASFEHIDGYLTLFSPLNRRLYRTKISVYGQEIYEFLSDLFKVRLERHNISFVATERFKDHFELGYPSTFYPTFVNLVDNAIYWLGKTYSTEKSITLDIKNNSFAISDNGPGIRDAIKDKIFDLGFSTKENGRGMGLFIAQQSLKELGYDLAVESGNTGTTFKIIKHDYENNDDGL
ncbi:MAG: ATP-binding protein [Methyloprofundus sp.]|nr:ATP-binding protein [Methyloprofundus sp.]